MAGQAHVFWALALVVAVAATWLGITYLRHRRQEARRPKPPEVDHLDQRNPLSPPQTREVDDGTDAKPPRR